MRTETVDRFRRTGAALLGAVLCLAGIAFAGLVLYVSVGVAGDHGGCEGDFWCPGVGGRLLVAAGMGLLGLGASALALFAGRGFIRYARDVPVTLGWSVLMAVLAPVGAIAWFFALLVYAAQRGDLGR